MKGLYTLIDQTNVTPPITEPEFEHGLVIGIILTIVIFAIALYFTNKRNKNKEVD